MKTYLLRILFLLLFVLSETRAASGSDLKVIELTEMDGAQASATRSFLRANGAWLEGMSDEILRMNVCQAKAQNPNYYLIGVYVGSDELEGVLQILKRPRWFDGGFRIDVNIYVNDQGDAGKRTADRLAKLALTIARKLYPTEDSTVPIVVCFDVPLDQEAKVVGQSVQEIFDHYGKAIPKVSNGFSISLDSIRVQVIAHKDVIEAAGRSEGAANIEIKNINNEHRVRSTYPLYSQFFEVDEPKPSEDQYVRAFDQDKMRALAAYENSKGDNVDANPLAIVGMDLFRTWQGSIADPSILIVDKHSRGKKIGERLLLAAGQKCIEERYAGVGESGEGRGAMGFYAKYDVRKTSRHYRIVLPQDVTPDMVSEVEDSWVQKALSSLSV